MNETGGQHSTQISKQCFQLLPFNIFAFLYPASLLFMDIVILNCVVYMCLQILALAADKQYCS